MIALPLRRSEPACPHCGAVLSASELHDGTMSCSRCSREFEATVFHPVTRPLHVAELAAARPEAQAGCANHARNAAAASCQRCGLLICALCDMDSGGGPYCPACFDRLHAEHAVPGEARRYVDYGAIARITVIIGVPMISLGLFVGSAALFFAFRGLKQRKQGGRSRVGMVILMLLAVAEIVAGGAFILLMVWGFSQAAKQ